MKHKKQPRKCRFEDKWIRSLGPYLKGNSGASQTEYSDTEEVGLKLALTPCGRKVFYLRKRVKGKKSCIKIGEFGPILTSQARKEARRLKAEIELGEDPREAARERAKVPTFRHFVEEHYLPHAYSRKKCAREEEGKLKGRILPVLGSMRIDEIKPGDVEALVRSIKEETSSATANRHHSLISSVLTHATRLEYIDENAARKIRKFRESPPRDRYLSDDELERFLAIEQVEGVSEMHLALFRFLLFTGLRKSEAVFATWKNLDLKGAKLFLPDTKSGSSRHVPLNSAAVNLLSRLPRLTGVDLIFHSRNLKPLRSPYKQFAKVREAAQIEDFRIHDFRHTFASLTATAGHSLYSVQLLLGHKSSGTAQRYAHLSDKHLLETSTDVSTRYFDGTRSNSDSTSNSSKEA